MVSVVVCLVLGLVLVAAAGLKAAGGLGAGRARDLGVRSAPGCGALGRLIAVEVALGVGVAAGTGGRAGRRRC